MKLQGLCKYYINCIELENNTTMRASMKDDKSFIALPWINKYALKRGEIATFLSSNRDKEKDLLIGFPILKNRYYISPLFILRITFCDGTNGKPIEFSIEKEVQINKDIIDKYSTNDKTENIYELRQLEDELGFSEGVGDIDNLQELSDKLRFLRPDWEWLDTINLEDLKKTALSVEESDGILNRAIIFAKEPTPYTVGLSNELIRLGEYADVDIEKSILWKFIHNRFDYSIPNDMPILEVLPLNMEQKEAVRRALNSDVTLIAGPPGTGKTQVVANLIVNAAIQGQSVLFTSKNNNAVDVVVKRVNALNKHLPFMIRYEKNTKQCIMDYCQQWENAKPKERTGLPYYEDYKKICASYDAKIEQKKDIVDTRNQLDEQEQLICQIRDKYKHLIGNLSDSELNEAVAAHDNFIDYRQRIEQGPERFIDKLFTKKWKTTINQQMTLSINVLNQFGEKYNIGTKVNANMSEREWMHFDNVFTSIMADLKHIADYNFLLLKIQDSASLEQLDAAMLTEHATLQNKALQAWNYWLDQHTRVFSSENRTCLHNYISMLDHDEVDAYSPELKPFLPACAITSLSARRRLPFKSAVYDLLIIDEASQCDIASMIPMLLRAKRVAVIGDKQQLNHICLINKQTDLLQMRQNEIEPRWSYRSCSIYDLAESVAKSDDIIQLRDHHRSYLDIIQFSNQEFYDNTLRIATDYRRLESPNNGQPILGMQWMNVKGQTVRPESGGAYNVKEAEGVVRLLRRLAMELDFRGSIGVTTPFHLQADMIKRVLEGDSDLRNHLEIHNQLLVDTVHKFQGDERDVIIFSPVVSDGTKSQSLQFLKSTGNLFNVAITRARSLLVTVGNKEYCKHCNVSYLEHFAEYSVGETAPVEASEWEHILQQALSDAGIPVTAQYHVDKYYLDLALFHNGKKLDIEIDGAMYHQTWSYELCYNDQLRNQALMQQGWDVIRFWVQQVRDQLPWCIDQIKKWMDSH